MTTRQKAVQQERLLTSATAWQKKPYITAVRAGTDIAGYLERYLGTSKKAQPAAEAFMKAVGEDWKEYCEPDKYEKGILYIHCLPGPCMHQLRTEQAGIIAAMKTFCPGLKLRGLRFTIRK